MSQFNVSDFCKRHLSAKSWRNERSQKYEMHELCSLINLVIAEFKKDSMLVKVNPPITVIGDIHGQYRDLLRILWLEDESGKSGLDNLKNSKFLFLGDYVDRGSHSVETISLLFSLKILFPQNFHLLRGNHESADINYVYGFQEELKLKMGDIEGVEIWKQFNVAFQWMPVAGLIGRKILCMHGGISPHLKSLEDILAIKRPLLNVKDNSLALDLLWSDPIDKESVLCAFKDPIFTENQIRGLSCCFNDTAVGNLCEHLKLDLIVRAHQVQPNGFKFSANRKLLTIFSAPSYGNEYKNLGAILRVRKNGQICFHILRDSFESENKIEMSSNSTSKTGSTKSSWN